MKYLFTIMLSLVAACDRLDERAVVRIVANNKQSSGFWYTKNVIVSTAHVAIPDYGEAKKPVVEYLDEAGKVRTAEPLDVQADFERDIMFLTMDYAGHPVCFGTAAIGVIVDHWYWIDNRLPSNTRGFVAWKTSKRYFTTHKTKTGYSGGPVTQNGCVIGYMKGTSNNMNIVNRIEDLDKASLIE